MSSQPRFELTRPPLELPAGKTLGPVVGLAIAPNRHIWVLHLAFHPEFGGIDGPEAASRRLSPVVEFDADGRFLQAWGGAEHLPAEGGRQQWPKQEETISIDAEGNLWIFGADTSYDHAFQRFRPDGKLLLRVGEFGSVGDDESRDRLGCPTDAYHDVERREVYVTDGYVNHRVVVFDSDTGAFKRAWGAYGKPPPFPASGPDSFNNPVHAISLGPEGHLYVCDRKNDRIQVFDAIGRDEPRFVRELEIRNPSPFGTTFNVAFSPGGEFMIVCDGNNSRLWCVDVAAWKVLGSFFPPDIDPDAEEPDLMATTHKIVTDAEGNLLMGRTTRGVEKMRFLGVGPG